MNKPLWTEAEAQARALELLAQFDREPDVLSPDEQALCIVILRAEQVNAATFRELVLRVIDKFVKKNATLPPADKPA